MPSEALTLKLGEFRRCWSEAGPSTIVNVAIEGGETIPALIREVARDPVTDTAIHVDFFAVSGDRDVHTSVPLRFVGLAPAVKLGATMVRQRVILRVTSRPSALVHDLEVDLSVLKTSEDSIRIADLALPEGMRAVEAPETVVVTVKAGRGERMDALEEAKDVAAEGEADAEAATDSAATGEKK
jgi:large subunit ribosomal protein L25